MNIFFMLIERVKNSTSFPLLMLTLSIQGFVIAAQFVVSLYLTPGALGTIRMFESLFSILLLTCLWGVPTLVFREAALTSDKSGLYNLFCQSIRAPVFVTSIVLFFTLLLLIFKIRYIFDIAIENIAIMAGLVYLSSPTRISTAIIQGGGIVKIYWFRIFLAAIAGTLIIVTSTFLYGENGWIPGRFIAEALIVAVTFSIFWAVRIKSKSIICLSNFKMQQLLRSGAVINAALIVRTLCENIPIILLKRSSVDFVEVGYFGVSTLWMFFPTLILAIYAQRETPKLIADFFNLVSFNSRLKNNLKQFLLISLFSVVVVGVIFILTYSLVLPKYALAIPAFLVLLATIPLRAITLVAGILFIAREQYKKSMFLNFFELFIILSLGATLGPESAIAVAWICFTSSIISAAISLKLIADHCSVSNTN